MGIRLDWDGHQTRLVFSTHAQKPGNKAEVDIYMIKSPAPCPYCI